MNILYTLPGCHLCLKAASAVVQVNIELPLGDKINILNIFSGDPRLRLLARYYGTNDPYEWKMPLLVLERNILNRRFGLLKKNRGERTFVHGILSEKHYVMLIREFLMSNRMSAG